MVNKIRVRLKFYLIIQIIIQLSNLVKYSFQHDHLPYALRQHRSNSVFDYSTSSNSMLPFGTSSNNLNQINNDDNNKYSILDYNLNAPIQLSTPFLNLVHPHHRHHHSNNHNKKSKLINKKRTILNNNYDYAHSTSKNEANSQRDYIATTIGKDVQLDCKMKNLASDDDKIVWLKMPKGEVLSLNSNRVTQDPRISTKCTANMTPCWSLIITNTRETDSGFYVCQTNAMQTKYVYLDIMVPPKLLTQYPVDRIDVNQSSNFSITCDFYGKPDPLIKWYKYHHGNQKEMEKFRGMKTISLFIHKDSPNEYECVADNSIPPTVSKKIYLNIQYSPQIKFLNTKVFQKKGERVIFDCKINSNPKSKIFWYKNSTRIHESTKYVFESLDDTYNRLYINNLTDSDFTDYYCTAVNLLGKATSKTELIELRTVSLNDPSKIQTTASTTRTTKTTSSHSTTITEELSYSKLSTSTSSSLIYSDNNSTFKYKLNETVIKLSLSDLTSSDSDDQKSTLTTAKLRNGKLPAYRSNKQGPHNHTRNFKSQRKQSFQQNQQSNQYNNLYTYTTKYSFIENHSVCLFKANKNLIFSLYVIVSLIQIKMSS